MKQLTCALLGYGDRCSRYAAYAAVHPEEMKVAAVIDPDPVKRREAQETFGLPEDALFADEADFLAAPLPVDFFINGTMDQLHYETSLPLLERGYDLLLEKPIVPNAEELKALEKAADASGARVVVCHVLRYTPFYSEIKRILDSGRIGRIVDMQLNEHIWYGHFVNAYVRGKWRSEKECGSGLLLAKCCHDIDLICWLNNAASPKAVSSFGSRAFFCPENAPEGSADYCCDCACRDGCMFNAYTFELEKDFIPFYTWAGIGKPLDGITAEEKKEYLRHSSYGQCVFRTDMDIVDRQCVSLSFDNGSVATLHMVGGTSKAGRHIHLICEYGEIVGYIEDNRFTLRVFDKEKVAYHDEVIDCNRIYRVDGNENSVAGHYGGDYFIMRDFLRYLRGEKTSASTTTLRDSVAGHMVCYKAEEARKNGCVVSL